jgi:hypothetical protein
MRFNHVFFENVHKHLKRIRIKVDPRHASYENFKSIDSYEGYILEENAQIVRVMVIKQGSPVVDIPAAALAKPGLLDHFKYFLLNKLQLLDSDPSFFNIVNAARFEDVEEVLKMRGTTDAEKVNFYREFIKNHEAL